MKKYMLFIIILLGICTRFLLLDRIPTAIGGDEIIYAITAKTSFLTGHDLSGVWNPLQALLFRHPPGENQAELPYFLHLLTAAFPFSLLAARIPFALLSVGIVVLLYLITKKLIGDKEAVIVGFAAAINPWLIVMGRTSYESTPATFFFLLGTYLMLSTRPLVIVGSSIGFLLAFYSYIGTKLIFLPFILMFVWYLTRTHGKLWKPYLTVAGIATVITLLFTAMTFLSPSSGGRTSEFFLPSDPTIAPIVDTLRKETMDFPFKSLFINKLTVYKWQAATKFFNIFSATYLFLQGDQFYSLWRHGFFYAIDIIFMLLGFAFLIKKKPREALLITALTILATMPQVFHKTPDNFSGHLALFFPLCTVFIGCGITFVSSWIAKRFQPYFWIAMTIIYMMFFGNFLTVYLYQQPLHGYFDFRIRVLSRYVTLARQAGLSVAVQTNAQSDVFKKYLFYSDSLNAKNVSDITENWKSEHYDADHVTFGSCNQQTAIDPYAVTIMSNDCISTGSGTVGIRNLVDAGVQYTIYNDSLCTPYELSSYPHNITLGDFAIETMSRERFCRTYINNLKL